VRNLAEELKEIPAGLSRNIFERCATRLRQDARCLDNVGRLVSLSAVRARSEIRRVGLDQDAIGGEASCDRAQVLGLLEGQNARERDVEAKRNRALRQIRSARITVKDGWKGALPYFSVRTAAISVSASRE